MYEGEKHVKLYTLLRDKDVYDMRLKIFMGVTNTKLRWWLARGGRRGGDISCVVIS